jgi:hypothetical protein
MENTVPDIFQDPELQAQFNRQGYLLLDFLRPEDVQNLEAIFHEWHRDLPQGRFMSDSYSDNQELKRAASQRITEVFMSHFKRYFKDFSPFGSSFLYKTPGSESALAPHQDWTIVDETKALALNIWVPLCDTTVHNGTLHILPGSHLHILPLRAPTLPFFFSGNEDVLTPYLVPVDVEAGQAVVLNQRLVHYSSPNLSEKVRIAITSGIKTAGVPMVTYYKDADRSDDVLEYFHQEDDFLISFNNFFEDIRKRPYLGVKGGEISYRLPQPAPDELRVLLNKMYASAGMTPPVMQPVKVSGWRSRVRQLLGIDG